MEQVTLSFKLTKYMPTLIKATESIPAEGKTVLIWKLFLFFFFLNVDKPCSLL